MRKRADEKKRKALSWQDAAYERVVVRGRVEKIS